ncbi:MAG: dehypoxanthine futalosine cyclase [Dehalococcoidia bacterium]|nr:dehypoxanthine futalosine cyclase [Dehalococcoidia bacterium]
MLKEIREKVLNHQRITREEGMYLLQQAPLLELAPLANNWRYHYNPDKNVTFVVDTNLNYTNVCDAYCTFCAFYRTEKDSDAYTHTVDEMMDKIGQAYSKGVTRILMQGGLNSKLPLEYYENMLREAHKRFPDLSAHFYSAPEVKKMAQVSGLSVKDVLIRLKAAGLKSIPGGGSEVLTNRVKFKVSRLFPKGQVSDWTEVHREAHKLGIFTTATMMYGHLEEDEDIMEHLDVIRDLQDETKGFGAFIPWSFKKNDTALDKRIKEEAGPNKYLRIIALSRIYLDNIKHIQGSWFSEGKKTGQVSLHFGADDFGGTLFDENVMLAAGFYNRVTVDEVVTLIRESGFTPVERTTEYEILRKFERPEVVKA